MSDLRLVYMTAGSAEEAQKIARVLVEHRLAACVNILGKMTSVYRWEGDVQQESEVALIAKTQADLMPEFTKLVKEVHSYDVPCIVALAIHPGEGNPDFLKWIAAME